ncbi:protein maelstrom homolog [Palaemon carinicauda]|uniref:protein maelstrom homolog n=1 Tax=Palaemon carinicauda TaxID=392227 RepID=UPI0035B61E04
MGKNKNRNEFYYYMVEMKPEIEKRLGRKVTMKELPGIVHPEWKKLSEAQRQSYQQLSKEGKDSVEKMDCNGVPIRVLQSKEEEKREQEENMTKEIRDTLEFLRDGRALHHNRIFIISTSEYCRTERGSVPAELSVLCFTFENGIEREHHKILKANIPACYAYTAREESARTHCLLPDNMGMTDDTDTEEVLHELVQFLLKDLKTLPPVFTLEEHRRTTEEVLLAISGGSSDFRVYSLDYYYQSMYLAALEQYIPMSVATDHLTYCGLDYHPNMPCTWHSIHQKDAGKYCTLSCARRWVFNMCDHINITSTFGIEPIEGKHLPRKYHPEATLIDGPRPVEKEMENDSSQSSKFVKPKPQESSFQPCKSSFQLASSQSSSLALPKPLEPLRRPNASSWSKVVSSTPMHQAISVTSGCSTSVDEISDEDFPALGAGHAKEGDGSLHRYTILGGAGRGFFRSPEHKSKDSSAVKGIGRGFQKSQ